MSTARARPSLWLVTPAWRRYELSSLCFEQHAQVMAHLEAAGVEARHVVVADDANLELAQAHGWDTVRTDNDWLGRKFNDGIEYAVDHGADFVVPIGSDSWIDPEYFLPLPEPDVVRSSCTYSVLTHKRLGELVVGSYSPAGPHVLPVQLLLEVNGRPLVDRIHKGCDTSTVRGLEAAIGAPLPWALRDLHPHQYVGLRGKPAITEYHEIVRRWAVAEHYDPWPILRPWYGDLVDRARELLTTIHTPRLDRRGVASAR